MIEKIINYIKRIQNERITRKNSLDEIHKWMDAGKPIPPPSAYKQKVIKDFGKETRYKILVETGTYLGEMVYAQLNNFSKIYSIELAETLFKNAVTRFKKDMHVTILHGDSGKVLMNVMPQITQPAIFWLDGHYSGDITAKGDKECPVFEELKCIFNFFDYHHLLLIDDARLFVGANDYPSIDELSDFISTYRPQAILNVENDIIIVKT